MTIDEMREQLQKITLTAKTEEGQAQADALLEAVMQSISDADIQQELDKQGYTTPQETKE